MISIVIPSLADTKKLPKLLRSLDSQKSTPYEVLLCTTGAPPDFAKLLPTISAPVRFLNSPENCISHARNLGARNADGDLILFLDEDCYLPHEAYLQDLSIAFDKNPNSCGGGFYLSHKENLNFPSRFYNFFCNLWLHANLSKDKTAQVLLGGCSFYPKKILLKHGLEFAAHFLKSGEEYGLNSDVIKNGYSLALEQRWSVYHNPDCNLKGLLKKAWVQGKTLDQNKLKPSLRSTGAMRFLALQPLESIKALPLLALYYLVGRTAYLTRRSSRDHAAN